MLLVQCACSVQALASVVSDLVADNGHSLAHSANSYTAKTCQWTESRIGQLQ